MIGDGPQNGVAIQVIRTLRKRTQKELGAAVDLSQVSVSYIETESRPAGEGLLDAIAAELDVPVDALLRQPRQPEPQHCSACGQVTQERVS